MMYTIEDLSKGRVAIINDGTLEELRKVLELAFPHDTRLADGTVKYYQKAQTDAFWFGSTCKPSLPTQSVKDFIWQPKRGDIVDVSDSGIWCRRIYLTTIEGTHQPIITVAWADEKAFKNGEKVCIDKWVKMRRINTEVSMEEIAEKFGIPVDQLKIKK